MKAEEKALISIFPEKYDSRHTVSSDQGKKEFFLHQMKGAEKGNKTRRPFGLPQLTASQHMGK